MPDIPLPKPPKPTTKPSRSNASLDNGRVAGDDLTPPPSRLTTQGQSASSDPSLEKSSALQSKPPATVTALHSVMPSGIPQGSNQPESDVKLPPSPTMAKPSLSESFKARGATSQPNLSSSQSLTTSQSPTSLPESPKSQTPPSPPPPPKPPTVKAKKTPKQAQPRSSALFKPLFIFGGLLVVGLMVFLAVKFLGSKKTASPNPAPSTTTSQAETAKQTGETAVGAKPKTMEVVELEYWGLWEPEEVMQPVIDEFEQENPDISVRYIKQSPISYRERLQNAINSGNGPDVFRFHATWVPMLTDSLAPVPASVMSSAEFQQTFYPSATELLQHEGQFVGLPIEYDGLMLFYNQEILKAANETPPKTWAQLKNLASKLTLKEGNKIVRAGVALGTAENTDHFSDILGLLMLQNGADLTQPSSAEVRDALIFYTSFVKSDKVWSETLPNSTTAFARGEAAMMFAPSWRAHEIKGINPELKFATAPVPQVAESNQVAWASFWAEGVSLKSKHQEAAWRFLKFLVAKETQKTLFSQASKTRLFGEPYSNVQLASELANDPLLGALMSDAPKAKSWYLCSNTFDNGLNKQMISYYKDAVNAILAGKDVSKVLPTLSQGVQQTLAQYNVTP